MPIDRILARPDAVGDKDRPVLVYCQSGIRSARAAALLRRAGYAEVLDLGSHRRAASVLRQA